MKAASTDAKKYAAIRHRLFFAELMASVAAIVLLQASGAAGAAVSFITDFTRNSFAAVAAYATAVGAVLYAVGLPFGFYKGHVVERRFGLSNQVTMSWVKDEIKKALISYAIFIVFAELLYFFLARFPNHWWLWAAAAWILFGVMFAKLAPVLIIPLFFKYEPLKNAGLKARLTALAKSCGVKIINVFRLNLSAKTRKANAALAGLGDTRRIILADTLLNNYSDPEIEAVMAHELGHHKFMHIWRGLVFEGALAVGGLYLTHLGLVRLSGVSEYAGLHELGTFIPIILMLTALSLILMPVENCYSRGMEKRADSFALELTGNPDAFISCMRKLARQNLADVSPSKFIEIMFYNHPPISKRIEAARKSHEKGRKKK